MDWGFLGRRGPTGPRAPCLRPHTAPARDFVLHAKNRHLLVNDDPDNPYLDISLVPSATWGQGRTLATIGPRGDIYVETPGVHTQIYCSFTQHWFPDCVKLLDTSSEIPTQVFPSLDGPPLFSPINFTYDVRQNVDFWIGFGGPDKNLILFHVTWPEDGPRWWAAGDQRSATLDETQDDSISSQLCESSTVHLESIFSTHATGDIATRIANEYQQCACLWTALHDGLQPELSPAVTSLMELSDRLTRLAEDQPRSEPWPEPREDYIPRSRPLFDSLSFSHQRPFSLQRRPDLPAPRRIDNASQISWATHTGEEPIQFCQKTLLGEGSFGKVHRAVIQGTRRVVAVKYLMRYNGDEIDMEYCRREADILSTLRHPHIIRLLGSQKWNTDQPEMIFELMDGSLADLLKNDSYATGRYPLKRDQFIWLVLEHVLKGLQHLHANGIVHRDLKPDNILYTCRNGEYQFRIGDFGSSNYTSVAKTCVGTPVFMAPEIKHGDQLQSDKADIWSLFVTVLWMVNHRQIRQTARYMSPEKISASVDSLDDEIRFLGDMASMDPNQRPSATELLHRLASCRDVPWEQPKRDDEWGFLVSRNSFSLILPLARQTAAALARHQKLQLSITSRRHTRSCNDFQ